MPQDVINSTDTLNAGRVKINEDVAELYWLASGLSNVAALRALTVSQVPTNGEVRYLSGYDSSGDGGESHVYYDNTDSTTADNGVTVFVDAAARRWKRLS